MDLRSERREALVLRTLAYGDNDLIVHLLVLGRGRLPAFARSARKSRERFGGALEAFQRLEVLLSERPSAELWTLREATLREPHAALRDDLHRLAHAGYAAELAHDLTRPGEPADGIFAALAGFWHRLCTGPATSGRLRALELALLAESGLSPELAACARCGGALPRGRVAFDPAAGGLLCGRCAGPGGLVLTTGARAALVQLQLRGLAGAEAPLSADGSGRPADLRAFEEACARAGPALAAFLAHQLGHTPRTASFLVQVGAPG